MRRCSHRSNGGRFMYCQGENCQCFPVVSFRTLSNESFSCRLSVVSLACEDVQPPASPASFRQQLGFMFHHQRHVARILSKGSHVGAIIIDTWDGARPTIREGDRFFSIFSRRLRESRAGGCLRKCFCFVSRHARP